MNVSSSDVETTDNQYFKQPSLAGTSLIEAMTDLVGQQERDGRVRSALLVRNLGTKQRKYGNLYK